MRPLHQLTPQLVVHNPLPIVVDNASVVALVVVVDNASVVALVVDA